jgi:hypothetical protein
MDLWCDRIRKAIVCGTSILNTLKLTTLLFCQAVALALAFVPFDGVGLHVEVANQATGATLALRSFVRPVEVHTSQINGITRRYRLHKLAFRFNAKRPGNRANRNLLRELLKAELLVLDKFGRARLEGQLPSSTCGIAAHICRTVGEGHESVASDFLVHLFATGVTGVAAHLRHRLDIAGFDDNAAQGHKAADVGRTNGTETRNIILGARLKVYAEAAKELLRKAILLLVVVAVGGIMMSISICVGVLTGTREHVEYVRGGHEGGWFGELLINSVSEDGRVAKSVGTAGEGELSIEVGEVAHAHRNVTTGTVGNLLEHAQV